MEIENEHTFRKALSEGVNLFLGAGFSVLAKSKSSKSLPVGNQLKNDIISAFGIENLESLELSQICTILESTKRDELKDFLVQRLSVGQFQDSYVNLMKVNLRTIFTTNIDDLLYKLFSKNTNYYLNDISLRGPVHGDRNAVNLIPLHGSIVYPDSSLTFSTTDISASFRDDFDKWHFLTGQLQQHPTLFWGYNLADAGVLIALNPRTSNDREQKDKWIVLYNPNDASTQYFRALNFNIIIADTREMLDYLESIEIKASVPSKNISEADLFPDEAIPSVGTVPVRPLLDFFLGDAPNWHDIFNNRIYKTSHYTHIIESVNSGKNLVVIGIPACGKTTLLMQVASGVKFDGIKLVCNSLTPEKTSLILQKLNGNKAIVFVDNFTEYSESFDLLLKAHNVQVLGFDREYNFDIVSHRVDSTRFAVIEVTDLTDKDVQGIYTTIPPEIRVNKYKIPKVEKGVLPSVYEIIETNTTRPSLGVRFQSLLRKLYNDDLLMHDLLVMMSYVHTCRTPVSFDMAYAFLKKDVKSFKEVYNLIDRLGSLIVENTNTLGQLIDSNQDYFVPRSTIISETIFRQVTHPNFKRVFLKFHEEVSTYRICNYDVFKRKAFDQEFAKKAFARWEDGRDFYTSVHERDSSPYLKQQGALYLAHKGRFSEAFAWIDEALLQSGYRIPSIRHSHAIILFKANIDKAEPDRLEIRQTLDESMKILSDCYASDSRKSYHALTFADQAIRYFTVFNDDTAIDYLRTASQWLSREERLMPWSRDIKRFSREIRRYMERLS